jgi:uncharacterized alpha-E superfamily protein
MLSRIAEALFWLGRYVERADDTARILDAFMHRLLDDPTTDEEAACRTLFAILGVAVSDNAVSEIKALNDAKPDHTAFDKPAFDNTAFDNTAPVVEVCDAQTVMERLGFDADNPSSVAGAWRAAHDNARGVREVISTEAWECLNATRNSLPGQRRAAGRVGPYAFLRYVRERAALFSGLADSTMSRDDGWLFLTLGRNLERVDMTARLLSVRVLASQYAPDWATLLRATGADEPYRRMEGWVSDPAESAARFLVLEQGFPRSIVHALGAAEQCLVQLSGAPQPVRARGVHVLAPSARRVIGRSRTMLEYVDAEHLVAQLPGVLKELQEACVAATARIAEEYFQYGAPVIWLNERTD